MTPRPPRPERQRGFALLVVIALMLPLAAFAAAITSIAQSELQVARLAKAAAQAEAMADGGVHEAIAGLLGRLPSMDVQPDGVWRSYRRTGGTLRVRVTQESGRIALNHADPAILRCAFLEAGLAEEAADRVIAVLRGPKAASGGAEKGEPGKALSVVALRTAPGMTPAAFAKLDGALSVYAMDPKPQREGAPPFVLATLERCPEAQGPGGEPGPAAAQGEEGQSRRRSGLVRIQTEAVLVEAQFRRTAVIDLERRQPVFMGWEMDRR